jgi:hypothetical protein
MDDATAFVRRSRRRGCAGFRGLRRWHALARQRHGHVARSAGTAMSVLLWASGDASAPDRIGRALALAEALGARGLVARIALPAQHAGLGWLEAAGVRNPVLLPEREPELPHVLAASASAAAVIVDVARPLSRAEARALAGGRPLVVVEGAGAGLAEADLVVEFAGGARRAGALAGPGYVPLRRAVRLARDLRARLHAMPVVAVHVGPRAAAGGAPVLDGVAAARAAGARFAGRILADPRTPAWPGLAAAARRLDLPPPIPALPEAAIASFAEADVAVVGGGMALWEAVGCGAATIAVGAGGEAIPLGAGGAVIRVAGGADRDAVGAAVARLVASPAARAALAAAGRVVVDGLGADRIADRLVAVLDGDARALDVRERHAG